MARRQRYILVLEPLPHVDAIRQLRWLLKRLGRQWGFRCVSIEEQKPAPFLSHHPIGEA
jgi:hypothetical protein